ncbi:glycosyltransferase [Bradyrhizobium yuanmingense]|uniref:glycosyltransferase n=1 Tax=Bradyrhizobium yuanmingense TaxID=108015 RepID=UPI00055CD0B6|nr:glycosyltransferase [Bradyrhizobium yuanmingense]
MRVLQIIPSLAPSHGGPTFVAMNLSKALADRGHQVHLLTTDRAGMPDVGWLDNVDVRISKEVFAPYSYSPDLSKNLQELVPQADLVHIHGLYLYPTVQAARIARRHDVPYIIRPAGALDPYHLGRKVLKKAIFDYFVHNDVLRNATAFHFTTGIEKDISLPRIFGNESIVVPNGLDVRKIELLAKPGQFRSRLGGAAAKRLVLFLGRINYKKGFEILIPAFAEAMRNVPDLHLVIAGNDDGHLPAVRALIETHGLVDHVTLPGFLGTNEKFEALADADAFVLPSYSENFANALFEALACGTPSIISNKVNSWPEIAAAGAAVVIDTKIEDLSAALTTILLDPSRRSSLASRAKDFARSNYDWANIAAMLETSYRAILDRLQSQQPPPTS